MDDTDVIFWMLLSVFNLPLEEQVKVIGVLPEKKFKKPYITNLLLFKSSLRLYLNSWVDEFDFLYDDIQEDFSTIYLEFVEALDSITYKDCFTTKDYKQSTKWIRVRRLGKIILEKADIPPMKIYEVIDFNSLVCVFINEDGYIQED